MGNKRNEVVENMLSLSEKISEELKQRGQEIDNIGYYKDFEFKGSGLAVNDVFIVKFKDSNDKVPKSRENEEGKEKELYEIYDKDNNLIATVDEAGSVQFEADFVEGLKEINERYFDTLELEEAEFELPEELKKDDLVLTKEELEEKQISKKLDSVGKVIGSKEIDSYSEIDTDQTPQFEKLTNKQELDADIRVTRTETLADLIPEL